LTGESLKKQKRPGAQVAAAAENLQEGGSNRNYFEISIENAEYC
jgi:hypothetical protein